MIRILYLGNKLSKHGNTPTSVETVGKTLSRKFSVITASNKKNRFLRLIDMWLHIVRYHRKIDYLLIDTYSTTNFHFAWTSAWLAHKLGILYIPILHGGRLEQRLQSSPVISRYFFSRAYVLVAPSSYLQNVFHRYDYKTVLIPNPLDIRQYSWKKREKIRPRLLYVRAFSDIYNPQMAIFVLKRLKEIYEDAVLCMVGPDKDGTLNEVVALSKKLGVNDALTVTGRLEPKEWHKISEEYDIFINTTNVDNTPVSVMEAMALGLPVVSTNVGGIPYLITDEIEGLLVPSNDDEKMTSQIIRLIESSKMSVDISKSARKKVEAFDIDKILFQWEELLLKRG